MANVLFTSCCQSGRPNSSRDAPPTHYTFKIQSFSLLSEASIERFESDVFEAGGYKWNLALYPNGNKDKNGEDHISLFLSLAETKSFPPGWEVNVIFTLFVYDQIQDKYFYFQDGKITRYHTLKTEWGVAQFINLSTFNDPSNGYLVNDTCVFGAEVFITKSEGKGACLSVIEGADITRTYTWKIRGFSQLENDPIDSKVFVAGDYKWKMLLYPKGYGSGTANNISLVLALVDLNSLPPNTKLYVKFNLRVIDQLSHKHFKYEAEKLFSLSNDVCNMLKFMSLYKLNEPENGFLRNDNCIIEADVMVLGLVTKLS